MGFSRAWKTNTLTGTAASIWDWFLSPFPRWYCSSQHRLRYSQAVLRCHTSLLGFSSLQQWGRGCKHCNTYGEDWCQIELLISSSQSLHQNHKTLNVFEVLSAWRTMRLLFLLWHQGSATAETAPGTTAGQDHAVVWLQSRFFYLKWQVNFTYQCKENWCCHLKIYPSFHFRSLGMAKREKLEMEDRHW